MPLNFKLAYLCVQEGPNVIVFVVVLKMDGRMSLMVFYLRFYPFCL